MNLIVVYCDYSDEKQVFYVEMTHLSVNKMRISVQVGPFS